MELNTCSSFFSNTKSLLQTSVVRILGVMLLAGCSTSWAATETPIATPKTKPAESQTLHIVNINTADAASLASLNGIGERKAMAIIDYRKQHGQFKTVEQLSEVKGIGDALIAKNRSRISVR